MRTTAEACRGPRRCARAGSLSCQPRKQQKNTPAEMMSRPCLCKGLGHAALNGWCGDLGKRRRRTRLMAIKIPERFTQLFIRARYNAAHRQGHISAAQASEQWRHSAVGMGPPMKRSPISQPRSSRRPAPPTVREIAGAAQLIIGHGQRQQRQPAEGQGSASAPIAGRRPAGTAQQTRSTHASRVP